MKWSSASQRSSATESVMSLSGTGSIAEARSSARESACVRMRGQSSTASRTSVSTRWRSLRSANTALSVAQPADLDAHPALDEFAGAGLVRLDVGADLEQLAQRRAADDDERVGEEGEIEACAGDRGGRRVDEEGHVIGDDQHSGAPGGVLDLQLHLAGEPLSRQIKVCSGRREQFGGGALA